MNQLHFKHKLFFLLILIPTVLSIKAQSGGIQITEFMAVNSNGIVDEDYISTSTSCGIGACSSTGSLTCNTGVEQNSCTPGLPAANDAACDGQDNDCDNIIDEDYIEITELPIKKWTRDFKNFLEE